MNIKNWPSFIFKDNIKKNQNIIVDKDKIYESMKKNLYDKPIDLFEYDKDEKMQDDKFDKSNKKEIQLERLKEKLSKFDEFSFKQNANFVFSDGNPDSQLMLIGEAPGEEEDKLGKPFVGKSGMLLNSYLETLHFDRTKYYITNIVPWRPPSNRTPEISEIEKMKPFINEHIKIIDPKLIITIGAVALKALGIEEGITKIQGKISQIMLDDKIYKIFPIYHPSYCLRMPSKKRDLWLSLLKMQEIYKKL